MMKQSRTLLIALAAAAISSAVAFVSDARDYMVERAAAVWLGLKTFAADIATRILAAVPETDPGVSTASLRGFVVHRAHKVLQLQRQRPRIEDSWRMCPSV